MYVMRMESHVTAPPLGQATGRPNLSKSGKTAANRIGLRLEEDDDLPVGAAVGIPRPTISRANSWGTLCRRQF